MTIPTLVDHRRPVPADKLDVELQESITNNSRYLCRCFTASILILRYVGLTLFWTPGWFDLAQGRQVHYSAFT